MKFEELQEFHNRMFGGEDALYWPRSYRSSRLGWRRKKRERTATHSPPKSGPLHRRSRKPTHSRCSNGWSPSRTCYSNEERATTKRPSSRIVHATVEATLDEVSNRELREIDAELFSEAFGTQLKEQLNKFNRYFAAVSDELYGERYALKADTKTVKGRRVYEFQSFNTNYSSGKKQGEISCFDIAYTLFADDEGIPCVPFSPERQKGADARQSAGEDPAQFW